MHPTSRHLSIEQVASRLRVPCESVRQIVARLGVRPADVRIDIRFDPSITEIVRSELETLTNGALDQ